MACIRLNTITVDNNSTLHIKNGNVNISNTQPSIDSMSGSLVLNGGLSIFCTSDAISSTSGGAITIGGGLSVKNQTFLGNNLILDNSSSIISVNGIAYPRLFLDSITNKQFFLSLDGINQHFILTNSNLYLNITQSSSSVNDGAVVLNGGLSINHDTNATSATSGGCLTIGGGASIARDLYIGNSLYIDNDLFIKNIISNNGLTISAQYIDIDSDDLSITYDSLNFNNSNFLLTSSATFNIPLISNNTSLFNNNVVITTNTTNTDTDSTALSVIGNAHFYKDLTIDGNINLNNTLHFNDSNTSLYNYNDFLIFNADHGYVFNSKLGPVSINSGILYLENYSFNTAHGNSLNITSSSDDSIIHLFSQNHDNFLCIYGHHDAIFSKSEYIKIGYDSLSKKNIISIETDGDGVLKDFELKNTNGKLTLCSDGSLNISSSSIFNGNVYINSTENSSLTISGGISVDKNINVGGDLFLSGKSLHVTDVLNIQHSDNININIAAQSSNQNDLNISLYSLGQSENDTCFNNLNIKSLASSYSIFSNNNQSDTKSIQIYSGNSNNNQLYISSNGNIGINNNNPAYSLDIHGNLNAKTLLSENASIKNNIDCNDLTVNNNVKILNDIHVNNNIYNDGNIICNNTSDNVLYIAGGSTIKKDLFIGGNIYGDSGCNIRFISVTNTNATSILTNGGIYINNTANSTSLTSGGALTVHGGSSVSGDLYIGKSCYLYDTLNTFSENLINIHDSFEKRKFSINYDNNTNTLSISRFDTKEREIEKTISFNNTNGTMYCNNTLKSINSSTASVVLSGGLSINCNIHAMNSSNGGSLTIAGGASISKNVFVGGDIRILSTSQSNNIDTGGLIVSGGIGVGHNINVGGNAVINGDLIVKGQTTNVNTQNTSIADNIIILNSGPSGSHDSGFVIQRYQNDNNTGSGDVVTDVPHINDVLGNQYGISSPSNLIKLSYLTSDIDNYYNNWWIKIDSGFSINQVRKIIKYDGTTHVATLSSPWEKQNPANGDTTLLFNKPFVGLIYNELLNIFEFGSTVNDPSISNVSINDKMGIAFGSALCENTSTSTSSSSGALVLTNGGLSINCSQDASSNTCGGGLTVAGGSSVQQSMYIGKDLYVNNIKMTPNPNDVLSSVTYTALNNQLDIPFITLNNSILSFDIFMGIIITMTDSYENLYCNFTIKGINKGYSWEIVPNYIGDDTGIEFDIQMDPITKDGLLRYSTPDYGFSIMNIQFKYKIITN